MTTPTIVLTGASSGIGAAIAERLVSSGYRVIGVGRQQDALTSLRARLGAGFEFHNVDLLDDDGLQSFATRVQDSHPSLDGLIHCAGQCVRGEIESISTATLDRTMNLNFRAPFLLTGLFMSSLTAARGHLVFINSSSGLHAAAGNAAYCASKFALRALADTARLELNERGIRVASIFPGRSATPAMEALCAAAGQNYRPSVLLQPSDIASAVLTILETPEHAEVTDVHIRPRAKTY